MSELCFRVRIEEPDYTVWTALLAFPAARAVAQVHRKSGLAAHCVYNAPRVHCKVEAIFQVAPCADIGLMYARGVLCKYVKVWRDPFRADELVTSKEGLAAALHVPPETIVEAGPLPLAFLLSKAKEQLLRLVGIVPRGREGS